MTYPCLLHPVTRQRAPVRSQRDDEAQAAQSVHHPVMHRPHTHTHMQVAAGGCPCLASWRVPGDETPRTYCDSPNSDPRLW